MTMRRWLAGLSLATLLLAVPGTAAAHAELIGSDPADGATLARAPAEVELTFDGELDPDGSAFTVIGPSGEEVGSGGVDLDVAERNVMRGALDGDESGAYEVRWTAASIDGHAEQGTLAFSVGSAQPPNTALPHPIPTWPLGVVLLAAAMALAVIRRRSLLLLIVVVGLAGCVSDNRPAACDAEHVTIDLALTATELTPNDPAVCRDQDVTLVVDSQTDGVLHLHGYDEAVPATTVMAGETVTLEFTASRSGQFPIELHGGDNPEGINVGIFTVHEP
ncbi:MAG TPA: copper resistance protein CopC [Candidatus Limnocylindria bacterium]|nr:copper resistance protein CopC [Candidatus Limnocylindria bacterium]